MRGESVVSASQLAELSACRVRQVLAKRQCASICSTLSYLHESLHSKHSMCLPGLRSRTVM